MDSIEWAFYVIETLFGVIVVFLMLDRKNVGARFAKLEEGKVDKALFDERTEAIKAQVCLIKADNKEDHRTLKDGIEEVVGMVGDIQIAIAKIHPNE